MANHLKIGDKAFLDQWKKLTPENRLHFLLESLEMPNDLSGHQKETLKLIEKFSDRLSPVHPFWKELAETVNTVFPKNRLSENHLFNRQIHQLRYLISSFQAQWIRKHYRRIGERDAVALARYLKTLRPKVGFGLSRRYDYNLRESARLHNKILIGLPHDSFPVNIKILIHFSTEFILSSRGDFVNEIDPEGQSLNGVVNGASFNYANKNDKRHRELDINPPKLHDPIFRKKMMKRGNEAYRSPKNLPLYKRWRYRKDWLLSYFNPKGLYAITGRSRYYHVRKQQKNIKLMIKERR